MAGDKPFFYRLDAGDFLAAVITIPEEKRGDWVLRLALDLVAATHSTNFAEQLISEARNFKEKKALAGKRGMESRYSKVITEPNSVITEPNSVITEVGIDITSNSNSSSSSNNTETDKPKVKRFVPPSIEEVTEYCQERKNGIDPQKFIDHYTANGWMVGKTKMKDWRAAVRTWEGKARKPTTFQTTAERRTQANKEASERVRRMLNEAEYTGEGGEAEPSIQTGGVARGADGGYSAIVVL